MAQRITLTEFEEAESELRVDPEVMRGVCDNDLPLHDAIVIMKTYAFSRENRTSCLLPMMQLRHRPEAMR